MRLVTHGRAGCILSLLMLLASVHAEESVPKIHLLVSSGVAGYLVVSSPAKLIAAVDARAIEALPTNVYTPGSLKNMFAAAPNAQAALDLVGDRPIAALYFLPSLAETGTLKLLNPFGLPRRLVCCGR